MTQMKNSKAVTVTGCQVKSGFEVKNKLVKSRKRVFAGGSLKEDRKRMKRAY